MDDDLGACPPEAAADFQRTDPVNQYLEACLDQIDISVVDGRIVAAMHVAGDALAALHVDPDLKGQHVGTAMMDVAEARGAVCLEVRAFNQPAIRFYEARGWRRTRSYLASEGEVPMLTHEYRR
ncbi:GNAT family N-acetyltransferase [Palleronia sp.]|uniref:GNAT family N-acetyltransferase n=1 Tax=Palleronia sp. TaxID=1940284 RepID=UPI0035C7F81E